MARCHGSLLAASLFALAAAELPPGLAPSWRGNVTCAFPGGSLASQWLMDLRPEQPRYKQLYASPSWALGMEVPWLSEVLQVDAKSRGPPDVTYGPPDDAACAPGAWPVVNLSNPFVEGVRTPGLNWSATQGSISVEGRRCRLWQTAKLPGQLICVASDGAPLLYTAEGLTCNVSGVALGPIPEEHFAPSEACRTYPLPPCPASGAAELTLYRLHSGAEPLELDNRDLGDALGAPSIVCNWPGSGQSFVTSFAVRANASWGQYGRCHYNGTNYCDASTGRLVGRQSPEGLPGVPQQGQCTANERRGSWYSFPAEGRCRPGEPLGSRGCTWSARPLRTVAASCVASARFKEACKREIYHGSYQPRSSAIIQRALASSDPRRGGCPDAKPGREGSLEIVV